MAFTATFRMDGRRTFCKKRSNNAYTTTLAREHSMSAQLCGRVIRTLTTTTVQFVSQFYGHQLLHTGAQPLFFVAEYANYPHTGAPQIGEQVTGMLDKLPGCIEVTDGPEAAPNSAMQCPESVPSPSVTATRDTVPRATGMPVPGAAYGLEGNIYLGCYNDSAGGIRTLNAKSTSNYTVMTPQYCQQWCKNQGYRLSGVEYAQECYCDNFINPRSINGRTQCTWNCGGTMRIGGRQEICGGCKSHIISRAMLRHFHSMVVVLMCWTRWHDQRLQQHRSEL